MQILSTLKAEDFLDPAFDHPLDSDDSPSYSKLKTEVKVFGQKLAEELRLKQFQTMLVRAIIQTHPEMCEEISTLIDQIVEKRQILLDPQMVQLIQYLKSLLSKSEEC